ncbi:neprilysin-2-like isoform X2 [Tribolium castaneum]|uniref:neprilysin-2-like isoform X2 n=1 Tax=Tribolium castaneum TaxID=7070 RepID=UPI00077DE95E|nr:PREDICTED: neprilysin-21-like isoform X2 [Tribolium castaneum]|eukprot:XP_015837313.1 PREDICTED: neprilysin-21-like isoform X2 [Tribolium castaneum]
MKTQKQSCCAKRTILEKILIVVVVLLVCILIALFCVFTLHVKNGNRHFTRPVVQNVSCPTPSPLRVKKSTPCMTQSCIKAASQIIDFIDPSVNPCDNFYDFVCGNFLKKPKVSNEITPLSALEAVTLQQFNSLITEPINETLPKSWALQRKYYNTCMNTSAIEENNSESFLEMLKFLGDWPLLHGRFWDERKFDWLNSMVLCRKVGFTFEYFLKIGAKDAANETGTIVLSINPPAVTDLPFHLRNFYVELMANISIELGAPPYLVTHEFNRVLQFEDEIKAAVVDEVQNGQEIITTIDTLENQFPSIPWVHFLTNITMNSNNISSSSWIHFRAGRYLRNLQTLLHRTPKSIQANYIVWKIIEHFRNYLKESVRSLYESFLIHLNPNLAFVNNRHLYCLQKSKFYFPSVTELAYVRTFLKPQSRENIKDMALEIKYRLWKKITANEWLDKNSKIFLLNKVAKIENIIGASDHAFDQNFDQVVEMDGFDLDSDNIIEMATKLNAKRADNYFNIINQKSNEVAKEVLEKSPVLYINAFYAEDFNAMIVPASFLQGVIYDLDRPQYMNYGALGSVIGHEYTHSFTTFAEENQTKTAESADKYEGKIQCLLEEYKEYGKHLSEFTTNAKSALEENIADLIGPDLAYEAYQQWKWKNGPEPTLPGLNYTQNQLFWIMSGAFKCYQPKRGFNIKFDQHHGVPSFAVTFSMRNSPFFAADFNCPVGANMNPEKKCRVL